MSCIAIRYDPIETFTHFFIFNPSVLCLAKAHRDAERFGKQSFEPKVVMYIRKTNSKLKCPININVCFVSV